MKTRHVLALLSLAYMLVGWHPPQNFRAVPSRTPVPETFTIAGGKALITETPDSVATNIVTVGGNPRTYVDGAPGAGQYSIQTQQVSDSQGYARVELLPILIFNAADEGQSGTIDYYRTGTTLTGEFFVEAMDFATDRANHTGSDTAMSAVTITSTAASGSDGFALQNNGARLRLGTYSYLYEDGGGNVTTGVYPGGTGNLVSSVGVLAPLFRSNTLTTTSVQGRVADGASAVALKFSNASALTTSGAKIASFYSDNGVTEKAFIDKDGGATFSGVLSAHNGGIDLRLLPGTVDHAYLGFFARTATPYVRTGYIGYGSAATTQLNVANEASGGALNLGTAGGGAVTINGNTAWHSGNDGAASTLDADLLDGQHAAAFLGAGATAASATALAANPANCPAGQAAGGVAANGTAEDCFTPAGGGGGVTSFNTRTGAVTLTTADVTGAGGAPAASPSFTGTVVSAGKVNVNLGTGGTTGEINAGPAGIYSFNGPSRRIRFNTDGGYNDFQSLGQKLVINYGGGAAEAATDVTFFEGGYNDLGAVGIGTGTLAARLTVQGKTSDNTSDAFRVTSKAGTSLLNVRSDGLVTVGANTVATTTGVGLPMDFASFYAGKPGNAALMYRIVAASPFRLPASLTNSKFYIGTNATATTTLTIKKNGTQVGTLSISTAGVFTPTFASQTDFAAGDRLEVFNQATADTTAADFSITLLGSRI